MDEDRDLTSEERAFLRRIGASFVVVIACIAADLIRWFHFGEVPIFCMLAIFIGVAVGLTRSAFRAVKSLICHPSPRTPS